MCRAFATLGHDPGVILLDAAACQMVDNIVHFRPQARPLSLPMSHTSMPEAIKTLTQVVSAKEQALLHLAMSYCMPSGTRPGRRSSS